MGDIDFVGDAFFTDARVCVPINYPNCLYEVRNQGRTHCCYGFVVVDCIYAAGRTFSLETLKGSEQEFLDCLHLVSPPKRYKDGDHVPDEGIANSFGNAFQYVRQYGLSSLEDYPWVGKCGDCKLQKMMDLENKIHIMNYVELHTIQEVQDALAQNIIVTGRVNIVERLKKWSGTDIFIYTENERRELEKAKLDGVVPKHAVAIIGFGEENGMEYYLLKNSYGRSWGHEGFFRILQSELTKYFYVVGPFGKKSSKCGGGKPKAGGSGAGKESDKRGGGKPKAGGSVKRGGGKPKAGGSGVVKKSKVSKTH